MIQNTSHKYDVPIFWTTLISICYILYTLFYWNIYIFQFSGLGQGSSTSIDLRKYFSELFLGHEDVRDSFKRAGFANATLDNYNLLPCSLGTFVSASRLECVECPAGKIYVVLHDYY